MVTGEPTTSLVSLPPEQSAKQKTLIPGAFTLKTNDDMELGRASNLEDQPGGMARQLSRISILR
jgi:hypothetical protein